MRMLSPARIIVVSLFLIGIGSAPPIVSFLSEHLPQATEWWPAPLSPRPIIDHLASIWSTVADKLYFSPDYASAVRKSVAAVAKTARFT
jgi:hypothetical protein